jgi:hypothetical protein
MRAAVVGLLLVLGAPALIAAAEAERVAALPARDVDALYKELVSALDVVERGGRWKDSDSDIERL